MVETGAANNGNLDIVLNSHYGFIRREGKKKGEDQTGPRYKQIGKKIFQMPMSNENRPASSLFSVKCHTRDVYFEDNH